MSKVRATVILLELSLCAKGISESKVETGVKNAKIQQ